MTKINSSNVREQSFPGRITAEKNKDLGLVAILAFLLCFFRFGDRVYLILSLVAAIFALILPVALTPLTYCWYRLSEALGAVMSRFLLTLVFFLVILPMGLLKRIFSKERLLMERWKRDKGSVFTKRDKSFSAADLEDPF